MSRGPWTLSALGSCSAPGASNKQVPSPFPSTFVKMEIGPLKLKSFLFYGASSRLGIFFEMLSVTSRGVF